MEQWKYQETYNTVSNYLNQILEHVVTDCDHETIMLPHFGIAKLGRSQLCKYNHTYTNDGTLGEIILNSMYIHDNPSDNEMIHYIMLAVDALAQHVVMCQNEGKKLAPHCCRVKTLLKKVGLVYRGTKAPLTFTDDSLLRAILVDGFDEETLEQIVYIEQLPPVPRNPKAQTATESTQNTLKFDEQQTSSVWQEQVAIQQKTIEGLQKTIQELQQQLCQFSTQSTNDANTNTQNVLQQKIPS